MVLMVILKWCLCDWLKIWDWCLSGLFGGCGRGGMFW